MDSLRRVRIKVCGMREEEDVVAAVQAGVDAVGFIFYEQSPRAITPEEAKPLIDALPPFVDSVGVFVDKKRRDVGEIIQYCRLDYAQLHGSESPKYCERLARMAAPCKILKAIQVGGATQKEEIAPYCDVIQGFLLDTYDKKSKGGTGKTFDWQEITRLGLENMPFLLAGGLGPDNISQALEAVNPYGVDLNSGVELKPGIKDHKKIQEVVRLIRQYDTSGTTP